MRVYKILYSILILIYCFGVVIVESQHVAIFAGGETTSSKIWDSWKDVYMSLRGYRMFFEDTPTTEAFQSLSKGEILFARTDVPMTEAQHLQYPNLRPFPILAGSVVIGFNLGNDEIKEIQLGRQALAAIFSRTITKWDDELIKKDNPSIALPNENIIVFVRDDDAGNTLVLTSTLNSFNSTLFPTPFISKNGWNANFTRTFGSIGVAVGISRTPYSIGYVGESEEDTLSINNAKIENLEGYFVTSTLESIRSAVDNSRDDSHNNSHDDSHDDLDSDHEDHILRPYRTVFDSPGKDSYPICYFSYVVVNENSPTSFDCELVEEVYKVMLWVITAEDAGDIIELNEFISLTEEEELIPFEIIKRMNCGNTNIYEKTFNPNSYQFGTGKLVIVISCFLMAATIGIGVFIFVTREYPAIKAFSPLFASMILLGCFFGFFSLIFWTLRVSPAVCILRLWFTSIGFPIILGNLLAKNYRLYLIFESGLKQLLKQQVPNTQLYLFSFFSVFFHIIILLVWTIYDPPTVSTEFEVNGNYNFCKSSNENTDLIFYSILLTYNGVILLLTYIISYLVRKLPPGYNESRHIAFVANNFLFSFLLVPIYLFLLSSEREGSVGVLYCILIYSYGFSLCILFIPKIHLVYVYGDSTDAIHFSKDSKDYSKSKNVEDEKKKNIQTKSHERVSIDLQFHTTSSPE